MAYGYWDGVRGYFEVHERDATGNWSPLLRREFERNTIVTDLDLDRDGDRLAFFVQDIDMEGFAVVLADVDGDRILMRHRKDAPRTSLALFGSQIVLSDDGTILAAASWGDSAHWTPEIFTLDDEGNERSAARVEGSARHLDLASDGSFLVFQNSNAHATQLGGNHNYLRMMGADSPTFDIRGRPVAGDTLELHVAGPAQPARLFLPITTGLLEPLQAGWRVDLSTLLLLYGPFPIDAAGWTQSIDVLADPQLDGLLLHVQAVMVRAGEPLEMTNKVSLRFGQ